MEDFAKNMRALLLFRSRIVTARVNCIALYDWDSHMSANTIALAFEKFLRRCDVVDPISAQGVASGDPQRNTPEGHYHYESSDKDGRYGSIA